jgi:cytochrome oxidase Cu insertion factor (SCO1/SenC/PrrC family)
MKRTLSLLGVAFCGVALGGFVMAQPPAAAPQVPPQVAAMDLIGKLAPTFTLPDQNDKPIKLADAKGKWVVLAFYPTDGTPG